MIATRSQIFSATSKTWVEKNTIFAGEVAALGLKGLDHPVVDASVDDQVAVRGAPRAEVRGLADATQIGRASCRERV